MTTTTITMPKEFTAAVQQAVEEAREIAVRALAAKHGFDAEEALVFLGAIKIENKRGPSKSEKSVKKTKAADPDKPKRAMTGYLLYQASVRDEVRAELEVDAEEGTKIQSKDVVRACAVRWQLEDDESKESWKEQAKALESN